MKLTWRENLSHFRDFSLVTSFCFYSSGYTAKFITEDKNPFKQIQQGILEAPSHIKHKMNATVNPSEKSIQSK